MKIRLFVRNDIINYETLRNVTVNKLIKAGALLISSSTRVSRKPQRQDTEIPAARSHATIISHGIAYAAAYALFGTTVGPRITLLPPDIYEPLSSRLVMAVRC